MVRKFSIFFLFTALFCGNLMADYAAEVSSDDPVAWWRFDELRYKDGLQALDETGNVNNSFYRDDAMTVNAGIGGKSGWFNGNKAGIEIGNEIGNLINECPAITFEAWVKNSFLEEGYGNQRIFATRISNAAAGIDIGLNTYTDGSGYVSAGLRSIITDNYLKVKADFSYVNEWTHLVYVINYLANDVKVYINGSLVKTETVNFGSNYYVYGSPTQLDQIGRAPDMSHPYRGWLDEIAVYDKALSSNRISEHYNQGNPEQPADLWVSQVSNVGTAEDLYVADPSVHKFDNGIIVASHNYYGVNKPVPTGSALIKISYNNGQTWYTQGQTTDVYTASLFEHSGLLYILGVSSGTGHITIAKSDNYGASWTTPTDGENGLLFEAEQPGEVGYSGPATPVLFSNGRIYRVFQYRDRTKGWWATQFEPLIISADINSDLLDSDSWTMTNHVPFDPSWASSWGSTSPGWLEGNAVEAPDGSVVAMMRVHSDPAVGKSAMLTLSEDNTTLSFDPATGFIDMPGGRNKFHILRYPETGKYLSLVNNNTDISRPKQRNQLSLIASDDLRNWDHVRTVIQDNSPMTWEESMLNTAFQYVVWEFDGDDIIFVSRTAYDGAVNYHDANRVTFHRISDYQQYVFPCGSWGYWGMDLNQDCHVNTKDLNDFSNQWVDVFDMIDFAELAQQWLLCTQPYEEGCVEKQP